MVLCFVFPAFFVLLLVFICIYTDAAWTAVSVKKGERHDTNLEIDSTAYCSCS